MITRETIALLIDAGSKAPSGDNSQPWYFRVRGETITVFQVPNKDNPFLNFQQGGTLLGCGAVIENIVIRASKEGIVCTVCLFPGEENVVATIALHKDRIATDPLHLAIDNRHTNRNTYRNAPLHPDFLAALGGTDMQYDGVAHILSTTKDDRARLGKAGSSAEIAILENAELHKLLFDNVVWSKEEESAKKQGLFIKTLELAPPQEMVFRLCRKWSFMQKLNVLGFAKFIAFDDAKKYATGGAYIAITTDTLSPAHFINAGRLMERIWLLATAHGYGVHPITATLFFGLKIRHGETGGLMAASWQLMREAHITLRRVLGVASEREVVFMFRIGEAKPVRHRSSKKPPTVHFEE